MENEHHNLSLTIRFATAFLIIGSILLTYNTMVVRHDYQVFTHPDGPEIEEE